MPLTKTEKHLIQGLKVFEVRKGIAGVIFMLLQDENQQWEMIEWMIEHRDATENELLEQARKIAKTAMSK